MKKLSLIVLTTVLSLFLSGCQLIQLNEVNNALENMETLDNYRMDLTTTMGDITINSYGYVSGEYVELVYDEFTMYYFIKDDGIYLPTSTAYGFELLEKAAGYETEEEMNDFTVYMDYEFEKVDDYYVFESDEFEGFDASVTIKIRIEEDYVKEIIVDGTSMSVQLTMKMLFSEYNEVEIDIPTYPTEEELLELETYLQELDLTDLSSEVGFAYFYGPISFLCAQEERICTFATYAPNVEYHMDTRLASNNELEDWYPVDSFLTTHNREDLVEYIEFLDFYIDLYDKYYSEKK